MSQPIIDLRAVNKSYTRGKTAVPVLRDLDLRIAPGEFVAVMGPSGSGKSTLLNLIGGLDRPTSGEVVVAGQSIGGLSAARLARWRADTIGFVFQFYNLLPVLDARANVELPLLLTGLSASRRRANAMAALKLVGIDDRAQHKPGELSGGQSQRVAIARALVADPRILVCDEPTGDLDRKSADEILALLRTLNAQFGKTIVMVTHDPKAAGHATRRLEMDKGLLVSADPAVGALA